MQLRPLMARVLSVLLLAALVFLCSMHLQFPPLTTSWLLAGEGIALVLLGCFTVSRHLKKEIVTTRRRLEETMGALAQEQELRQRVEGELEVILSGLKERMEEQNLLSTVIEQTEDNVLITDSNRTIIYINPAFERSSGYTCDELKGKPLRCLRSDQHDPLFFQTMKEILDRGEVWLGIIINKGKGGVDFEIEGTISPILDASGRISHWVAVGRNLSRLRKLEKELQRAQKMDALGTLAGGIAHDFNNILAAVMGLIEMEFISAAPGSRTLQRMEQAMTACGRARDLVRQILTFSSQGGQRRTPLRMAPVIEDALKMLRATLPTTIAIQPDLHGDQALILGDSIQIHQVLINLCTNAAHSMRRSGGVLGVGLREVEIGEADVQQHPDLRAGSYLCLTVSDTGEGMTQSVQERIFEPFFTTKAPGEGAGVGLSVVHGIVKSHGGKIIVRSELGKGSTFELYFPRIQGEEAASEDRAEALPTGKERILLVDDEEIVVAVAFEMLRTLGYEVAAAQRGAEALEILRTQPDRFHLLMTDQTMPGMTGIDLAAEARRIRPGLPIILCTGFSKENIREKATAVGIRKILSKPFVLQELATSVREILDQRR